MSLNQVQDQSTESFKLTKGLFRYIEGEVYCQNRDYKRAIESLQSSLDLMEESLKLDTIVARCYNALGNCYYGLNQLEKALELYYKALRMRKELSGSDCHCDMAVFKNQIGTVHEDKGEYDEAVEWYKNALELLKELKCLGHKDEALFRRNLANVYIHQMKYKEAEEESKKALNIRLKWLKDHPDTVRSHFQLGVIQANLRAFGKALDCFIAAWNMEKSLGVGNHSAVWRRIIIGVFDMCDFLNNKHTDKIDRKKFRQDALEFCQCFWEEEKASPQFSFTAYNKEIIDAILYLLGNVKETETEERALADQYVKEAVWFYDGLIEATEEHFNGEFDKATDNKVLNEMLRERTALLERLIEFCLRHNEHKMLLKHKRGKMTLFKKVLVRSDFVGEEKQKKACLKSVVEQLYKDLGEKGIIKIFREDLLATWQRQWEEGKGTEESREKLVARERIIKGIRNLCAELEMKDLLKRYQKEYLSFLEKLWELHYHEMESSHMEKLLRRMKNLATSIKDHERRKVYKVALEVKFLGLISNVVDFQYYRDDSIFFPLMTSLFALTFQKINLWLYNIDLAETLLTTSVS